MESRRWRARVRGVACFCATAPAQVRVQSEDAPRDSAIRGALSGTSPDVHQLVSRGPPEERLWLAHNAAHGLEAEFRPESATFVATSHSVDFNARIQSGVDPTLLPGVQVNGQFWTRDSGTSSGTGLTDAIEFVIQA